MKKVLVKGNLIVTGSCSSVEENGLVCLVDPKDITDAYVVIDGDVTINGDLLVEEGFSVNTTGGISSLK